MGNYGSGNKQYQSQKWLQLYQLQQIPGKPTLLISAKNQCLQAQKYTVIHNSNNQQTEASKYERRLQRHQNIVQVYSYEIRRGLKNCIKTSEFVITTERLPFRLRDLQRHFLGISETLYILKQTLNGYEALSSDKLTCLVTDRMIAFSSKAQVKVWIHDNLAINYPLKAIKSEHLMVDEIINTVFDYCQPHEKSIFYDKIKTSRLYSFHLIKRIVESFKINEESSRIIIEKLLNEKIEVFLVKKKRAISQNLVSRPTTILHQSIRGTPINLLLKVPFPATFDQNSIRSTVHPQEYRNARINQFENYNTNSAKSTSFWRSQNHCNHWQSPKSKNIAMQPNILVHTPKPPCKTAAFGKNKSSMMNCLFKQNQEKEFRKQEFNSFKNKSLTIEHSKPQSQQRRNIFFSTSRTENRQPAYIPSPKNSTNQQLKLVFSENQHIEDTLSQRTKNSKQFFKRLFSKAATTRQNNQVQHANTTQNHSQNHQKLRQLAIVSQQEVAFSFYRQKPKLVSQQIQTDTINRDLLCQNHNQNIQQKKIKILGIQDCEQSNLRDSVTNSSKNSSLRSSYQKSIVQSKKKLQVLQKNPLVQSTNSLEVEIRLSNPVSSGSQSNSNATVSQQASEQNGKLYLNMFKYYLDACQQRPNDNKQANNRNVESLFSEPHDDQSQVQAGRIQKHAKHNSRYFYDEESMLDTIEEASQNQEGLTNYQQSTVLNSSIEI